MNVDEREILEAASRVRQEQGIRGGVYKTKTEDRKTKTLIFLPE